MRKQDLFFHTHAHSRFSSLDAMTDVEQMVRKAHDLGQPAVSLTDHGNMSGTVELYQAGKSVGLPVFPGLEGYLVETTVEKASQRYHVGFLSLNLDGYRGLVKLSSESHRRENFHRFPRFDLGHLAQLAENEKAAEGIGLLTGCYFGFVQQTLVKLGYDAAKSVVEMYARWFPHTFVELQNHNIDHDEGEQASNGWTDEMICEALARIADEVGLPLVATQDSHYLDMRDKAAHEVMKNMVYGGDPGQNEFPGDSFHFASSEWVEEHHDPKHWERAQEGFQELLSLHDLVIPALDSYKPHIPRTVKSPVRTLRRLVYAGLDRLESQGLLKKTRKRYEDRLEHELETINHLGMAGYFMLWVEVVEWCRDHKVAIEARGSSNGSLVCYSLGITSVDPLQWDLLFERFLSKDRKKPADIDLDIEDRKRDELVAFLRLRFNVEQIGTFGSLGARDEDDKGSVLVSYNSYLRRRLDAQHGKGKGIAVFNATFGPKGLQRISDIRQISKKDYEGVRQLSKHNVSRSYGVHAAGLLLAGADQNIGDYVPTMLVASSGTVVTQFTMDDVEELGFLKLDILGQRTLAAMARCQEMMGRDDINDFSWIPMDDPATCRSLREGRAETGVFQFEGYSMAKGGKALGIRNTNDCIIAGALFRPACIASGMTDLYLTRRKDPSLRKNIEYPHTAFEEVLKSTYGVVLFQEQVLEIMRRLGLDYEGINTFFKIVKDSGKGATARNRERAAEVKKTWGDICERNGITDPEAAWHFIEGYTQYGFNKAHSTGYGIRSYRAAYLKTHFPIEYMTAILESVAGSPKETVYKREARHLGIRMLPPDVNISGRHWTIDRKKNAIRQGLLSIKGVGETSAFSIHSNAPYADLDDLIDRNSAQAVKGGKKYRETGEWTSTLLALRDSGALASLGIGRGDE